MIKINLDPAVFILIVLILSSCSKDQIIENRINLDNYSHVIFVNNQYEGISDGSMKMPYNSIQVAVNSASNGEKIFVSAGIYYENVLFDSNKSNIELLGGFSPQDWKRNIENNRTVIDGGGPEAVTCIRLLRSSDITISGFWLTNAQRIIAVYPAKNVLIERNYIYDAAGDNYTRGIVIESLRDFTTENVLIKNNVIWNIIGSLNRRGSGISITYHQSDYPVFNIEIFNNTVYNVSQDGIYISHRKSPAVNVKVKNNIVVKAGDTGIQIANHNYGTFDYNCVYNSGELYYGELVPFNGGLYDINARPIFVNVNDHNFRIISNSPTIDAGDPDSEYSNEPEPNGNRINIGAYGNTNQATKSADSY